MTVLPIVVTGHPALHTPAEPVEAITPRLHQLVAEMVETMHEAPGVGLAAPQVGVSLQVFVWSYDDGDTLHEGHVLNPHLTVAGLPHHLFVGTPSDEGCLSIPGFRAPLARFPHATLTGMTLDGNIITVSASGWLARIFQHEYDHVRGVLYADRLRRPHRNDALAHIQALGLGTSLASWTPGVDGEEDDFWSDDDGDETAD